MARVGAASALVARTNAGLASTSAGDRPVREMKVTIGGCGT